MTSRIDGEVLQMIPRRIPVGCSVAISASGREACSNVVRIGRAVVIILVAENAFGRRPLELAVHMTLRAGSADVRTRQREVGAAVIIRGRCPAVGRMASRANMIVIAGHVIGIGHAFEIRLMA